MTTTVPPAGSPTPEPGSAPGFPADSAGLSDLCRLTVFAGDARADLAVPSSMSPGVLIPVLTRRMVGEGSHRAGNGITPGRSRAEANAGWVLQRVGEAPLDDNVPIDAAGILDGDVLHLRPATDPLPELHYDDLATGIMEAVRARGDRWTPPATRRLLLLLAGVALLVAVAAAVMALPPELLPFLGAGFAVVLTGAAVLLARRTTFLSGAVFTGFAALALGALAGLDVTGDVFDPGTPGLLAAGTGVILLAAVIMLGARTAIVAFGAVLGIAVALVSAVVLVRTDISIAGAVAIVAVTAYFIGSMAPRLSIRAAGLRVPQLPRTASELQDDIEPVPGAFAGARTAWAENLMSIVAVTVAVSVVVAAAELDDGADWASRTLGVLLAVVCALRGRALLNIVQRTSLVLGGTAAAGLMLIGGARDLGPFWSVTMVVLAAAGAVLAVVAAWRLAGRRLLPIWGQVADLTELILAIALVPVLLQILGVYAYFRALNG